MNTFTWRRRLTAALLLPFLLVLAGCGRLHADFEINSEDDIQLSLDIAIEKEYMEDIYSSAEEMCTATKEEGGSDSPFDSATLEAYEEDGMWGCRGTGGGSASDLGSNFKVTEESGKLHLVIAASSSSDTSTIPPGFDMKVTFNFPGKVLESKGGQIDGSTVTYTDIDDLYSGVDITAKSGGGFLWVIIALAALLGGFVLLLALAAGAFFFMRSRKKGSAATAPGAYGAASGGSRPAPPAPGGYGSAAATGSPAAPPAPVAGHGSPAAPQAPQGSPAVPSAPAGHGSPAAPQAPQGSHAWGGADAQGQSPWSKPAQGQQQGQSAWGQQQPGQGQSWNQAGQEQQPWNQQPPQNPPQPPQNPTW